MVTLAFHRNLNLLSSVVSGSIMITVLNVRSKQIVSLRQCKKQLGFTCLQFVTVQAYRELLTKTPKREILMVNFIFLKIIPVVSLFKKLIGDLTT